MGEVNWTDRLAIGREYELMKAQTSELNHLLLPAEHARSSFDQSARQTAHEVAKAERGVNAVDRFHVQVLHDCLRKLETSATEQELNHVRLYETCVG